MLVLLLLITVIVPCWYAYQRSVSHGLVEINHVTTLSFGFLFYWITPLAVRIAAPNVDFPLASTWSELFQERVIAPYAISCIVLYLCFAIGDSLGIVLFTERQTKAPKVSRLGLSFITASACLLMAYSAFIFRAPLLRTATPDDIPAQAARGALTACVVLMGAVAIIFTVDRPLIPWRKRLLSFYFLPLMAGGVILLMLGSRLYVASLLVMFAIYQTNFVKRFRLRTVTVGVVVFCSLFGVLGRWREKSSVRGAFFNVFEETMFISLPLVHHLCYKGIAWINSPTQLASDFENLVPTVLVPNKSDLLKKPDAYSPLGGLHSFVSFNLYFGILGTALFWFLWPMGFRYLKSRSSSTLFATMYIMCSGWLTFTFFRDPFSISLVKAIFEDSILWPIGIVSCGYLLSRACALPAIRRGSYSAPDGSS